MSSLKSRDNSIFSSWIFQSKNIISCILCFLCQLYILKGCYFQCVVSNFYRTDHILIFHVRRGMGICHLILYDPCICQAPLGVQSLEKLENSLLSDLCLCLWLILIYLVVFTIFRAKM